MSLTSTAEPGASPAPPTAGAPIDRLFIAMTQLGASDLHLCVGSPALVRKDGRICPLDPNMPALTDDYLRKLIEPIMPAANREEFAAAHDTDFAYEVPNLARFRANVFADRKGRGAVFASSHQHPHGREARPVASHPQPVQAEQRAGARDRSDRLWQVDDAVRDDRLHQPHAR
jgi:hypothetical protein